MTPSCARVVRGSNFGHDTRLARSAGLILDRHSNRGEPREVAAGREGNEHAVEDGRSLPIYTSPGLAFLRATNTREGMAK